MTEHTIRYPMTADYRKTWGVWEALREIYQEYLDLFHAWTVTQENGILTIQGVGSHMRLRNLLLGGSDKHEGHIGKFGEGTKIAWLVLLRAGIPFRLTTGEFHNLHARWADLYGEQVLEICWTEGEMFEGARYELEWSGDTYMDRVIRPNDPRILFQDSFGRMILEEEDPAIYVKGLWTGPAKLNGTFTTFSYNLPHLTLAEDRQVTDNWQVSWEIGKTWCSVDDEDLIHRFWHAIADRTGEYHCYLKAGRILDPKPHARAIRKVFGSRVALSTDPILAGQAASIGIEATVFPNNLAEAVAEAVGTEAQHIAQLEGAKRVHIPIKKLEPDQRRNLNAARRAAQRGAMGCAIEAYVFPDNQRGAWISEGRIGISVQALADPLSTLDVLVHELAHNLPTKPDDGTPAMVDAATFVGAKIIAAFMNLA